MQLPSLLHVLAILYSCENPSSRKYHESLGMEIGSSALPLPSQSTARPSSLQGYLALARPSSTGFPKQSGRSGLPDYLPSRSVHVGLSILMDHYYRLPHSWRRCSEDE